MSHDKSDDEALEDPMRPMDMVNALLGKVETTPIDISVVIPHLNQPEHLRRSLEAVHTQKGLRANFEVIVVDNDADGSARAVTRGGYLMKTSECPEETPWHWEKQFVCRHAYLLL